MKLTAAEVIVKFLIHKGIRHVFGICGHGNWPLLEALKKHSKKISYIQIKNEQYGAYIALGYAMYTGEPLVVTTSVGPGSTNLVTAAGTAYANRTPILCLIGDVYISETGSNPLLQEIEHPELPGMKASDALKPVARFWDRVENPGKLQTLLNPAWRQMMKPGEEGPAVLSLPMDIQAKSYDYDLKALFKEPYSGNSPQAATSKSVYDAAKAIKKTKRPLIVAGGGAIRSHAWDEVEYLATMIGAPVIHTHAGNGTLLWDDPYNAHSAGPSGGSCGNTISEMSDLVIGVGTRYSDFTTRSNTLFDRDARFININICHFDAGKNRAIEMICDAKTGLTDLILMLCDFSKKEVNSRLKAPEYWKKFEELRREWQREVEAVTREESNPMTQARVIGVLNDIKDENTVIVNAAGSLPGHLLSLWKATDPARKSIITDYGYSCMGFELPAALGVKIADPARYVIAAVGDATFLMGHSELITGLMEGIPITVMVFDNGGPQVIRNGQKIHGFQEFGNEFRLRDKRLGVNGKIIGDYTGGYIKIDYKKIAEGYGLAGFYAETPEQVAEAVLKAKKVKDRPSVIHVKIEPGRKFPSFDNAWWYVPKKNMSDYDKKMIKRRIIY